jgi:hypothetical protein
MTSDDALVDLIGELVAARGKGGGPAADEADAEAQKLISAALKRSITHSRS